MVFVVVRNIEQASNSVSVLKNVGNYLVPWCRSCDLRFLDMVVHTFGHTVSSLDVSWKKVSRPGIHVSPDGENGSINPIVCEDS